MIDHLGPVAKFRLTINWDLVLSFLFWKGSRMSQLTFKGSHFPKRTILLVVFWYLRYFLNYRNIEERGSSCRPFNN